MALKFCLEIVYNEPSKKLAYNGSVDFSSDQLRIIKTTDGADPILAGSDAESGAISLCFGL